MDVTLSNFGVLQIEPTDHCNLHCRMCQPHFERREQIHGVPKGLMDLELYRSIIAKLAAEDCAFDHLIFQWLGDPSLHPQLDELVAIAQRGLAGRVGYLRIDTNAITLTPARMERLVEVYARCPELPLLLVFTLDAHTADTYRFVKGQDALERARRHVRHFVMRRAKLPFDDVRLNVQVQFVVQPGNAGELGDFVRYWDSFFRCHGGGKGYNELMVKRLSVAAGGAGQLEADQLYERAVATHGVREEVRDHLHIKVWENRSWDSSTPGPRQPCPGLWMTPVIRHDGRLMMCCADLPGELELGNLATDGFRALWEGREAVARRLAHVRGAFHEVGPCEACGGIAWYRTTPAFVRSWLDQVGHPELWPEYARRISG